ncbi:tetratricopeptide repeat protein [Halomonas denitrificans]|nr:tetratricopeptide repeat protein [Halomonas denitrificans]
MPALVLLAGCAGTAERPLSSSGPDDPQAAASSTEGDVAIRSLLADARQAQDLGDAATALDLYLEAMVLSERIEIAEQATRVAAQLGDWPAVDRAARRWLELDPDAAPPHHFLILGAFRQDDLDAAGQRLGQFIERSPGNPSTWGTVTALLPSAPSPSAAEAILDALLQRHAPVDDPAFADLQRSRLQVQLDRLPEAMNYADRAFEAQPSAAAAMWAGRLAEALGEVEGARARFAAARQLAEDPVGPGLAEVELLRAEGRREEALAVLAELPPSVEVLYARVLVEHQLGRKDRAREHWHELAELSDDAGADGAGVGDPDQAAWLTALAAEAIGLNEAAIDWFDRVRGPARPDADLRRAALLGEQGEMDRASDLFAAVRALPDPRRAEQAWLIETELLLQQGRGDEALAMFSDALAETPGSAALLYGRAMAAVRLDRLELAEQDLRTLIQREPDNALALNALGYTLSDRTDRQREAYRLIERALAIDPENPAILDSMGWVLFKLGRAEQAAPYLERAATAELNAEIVAHLVEVLWALERYDEARVWIERGRAEFPDDPLFVATLERVGVDS